ENDAAIEIEHVGWTEEQRRRRERTLDRADLEGPEQDQELADKPAGAGQSDRRQGEHHEDESINRHALDEAAETHDLVGMQGIVEDDKAEERQTSASPE